MASAQAKTSGFAGRTIWWCGLVGFATSCTSQNNPKQFDRYLPESNVARQALDASLGSWKTGSTATLAARAIDFEDRVQRQGRGLVGYEIIGEVSGERGRWFEVVLDLEAPREQRQTRYVVIGIKPLWVIRDEDFELIAHWDHPMEPAEEFAPEPEQK